MKNAKSNPRKWRLNCIIVYKDEKIACRYRSLAQNVLENIAALRKIDYAIMDEYRFEDETIENQHMQFEEPVVDLVYFRSSAESLSSITEFRNMIDQVFHRYSPFAHLENQARFGVYPQALKLLPKYPFPENDYLHPLEYPFLEYHKDGKVTLCVPDSTVQQVLDDVHNDTLN